MCDHRWKIMHAGPIAVRLCLHCGTIAHLPPRIDDTPAEVAPLPEWRRLDDEHDRAIDEAWERSRPL